MSPEHHSRAKLLFLELREIEALPERQRTLERIRATEPEIATEVEALLTVDAEEEFGVLDAGIENFGRVVARSLLAAERLPTGAVPGLEVDAVLGVGSYSIVYRAVARSDNQFGLAEGQTVALKMLRPSAPGQPAPNSFEREVAALRGLDHDHIVRVLGWGRADSGGEDRPFLITELVTGLDLSSYRREFAPSVDERLDLLESLCDALHHAHTRGVLHADVKPENILVTEKGHLRLVDFGLSCTTEATAPFEDDSATARQAGSLPYMSPERLAGGVATVADEVFAVGVLAYRLLSGESPFQTGDRSLGALIAERRGGEVEPLDCRRLGVRPSFDWVIQRALHPDPSRRFATIAEFRGDLKRCRVGLDPATRPPGLWLRARAFSRRHKTPVRLATAVVAVLLVGLVGTSIAIVNIDSARRQEAEARRAAEAARADTLLVKRELLDVLQWLGGKRGWRAALQDAEVAMRSELADRPEIGAELASAYSAVLFAMGHLEESERMLDFEIEKLTELHGPDSSAVQNAILQRDGVRSVRVGGGDPSGHGPSMTGDPRDAGSIALENSPQISARVLVQRSIVAHRSGELDRARSLAVRSLDFIEQMEDGRYRWVLDLAANHEIAGIDADLGRREEAKRRYEATIELADARGLEQESRFVTLRSDYALFTIDAGEVQRGLAMLEDVLAQRLSSLGPRHVDTLQSMHNLGAVQVRLGSVEIGVGYLSEALEGRREVLGADHHFTLNSELVLLGIRSRTAPWPECRAEFLDLIERLVSVVGRSHADVGGYYLTFSDAAKRVGEEDDARRALAGALEVFRSALGPDHPRTQRLERAIDADHDEGIDGPRPTTGH